MIEITNEYNQEYEEFATRSFTYSDDEMGAMADEYAEFSEQQIEEIFAEEPTIESDAPQSIEIEEVEQSTEEEEKVEESATDEVAEESTEEIPSFEVPPFCSFADTMRMWIEILAKTDEDIAKNIKKENKSFKECADYILNYVSSHRNGLSSVVTTSDALLPLVKHYYEDDNCKAETTPKNVVAQTSVIPTKLQNTLDKVADNINKDKKKSSKKKTKAEQKKEEHDKKIAVGASLELPNTTKAKVKVFSGLKKGTTEYNKAVEEQTQLSLFDF